MIIIKNWRPNCSNPFSLNIAELIAHLNGEEKTIYWLHYLNLPPLKQLQQIFVLYEAKVMIYDKKVEKIQKVEPISSILNANKNIGSNSRFAKVYCCPISTYPTCVSRPPCFLIFRWLSSLFLQLLVFLLQEISSFVLVAHCLAVMLITIQQPVSS